jgi:hypothetical protein
MDDVILNPAVKAAVDGDAAFRDEARPVLTHLASRVAGKTSDPDAVRRCVDAVKDAFPEYLKPPDPPPPPGSLADIASRYQPFHAQYQPMGLRPHDPTPPPTASSAPPPPPPRMATNEESFARYQEFKRQMEAGSFGLKAVEP